MTKSLEQFPILKKMSKENVLVAKEVCVYYEWKLQEGIGEIQNVGEWKQALWPCFHIITIALPLLPLPFTSTIPSHKKHQVSN